MVEQEAKILVFVALDRRGEYEVGVTEDEARERFGEYVSSSEPRHIVRMTLTVPLASLSISAAAEDRLRKIARRVRGGNAD